MGSAATTTCSAIMASNFGIADSINMKSVPAVVMVRSGRGRRAELGQLVPSDGDLRPCHWRQARRTVVHVEHLSTLDAGFLEAEDSDRHVSLAVGGLSVIEGPMPEYDSLVAGIAERILAVPRFRQVLNTHLFDLGAPEWIEDPNLDLCHHVHRAALPHPGDDEALFRLVADVMERRLDRDRPLWECWIIEGLADQRWALLMKIHHCIADGIATMHMLGGMSDGGLGDTFATEIRAAHAALEHSLHLPKPSLNPLNWVRGAWHASTTVTNAAALALEGAIEIAGGLLRPAAPSSLIGPSRRCDRGGGRRLDRRRSAPHRSVGTTTTAAARMCSHGTRCVWANGTRSSSQCGNPAAVTPMRSQIGGYVSATAIPYAVSRRLRPRRCHS